MSSLPPPTGLIVRLALVLCTLAAVSVQADVAVELSANEGYNGNLFDVENRVTDYSTGGHAGLRYYPVSSLELSGSGDYNRYKETSPLSSFARGLQATYIPLTPGSRLALHIQGEFERKSFSGDSLQAYNTNAYAVMLSTGYQFRPRVHLRANSSWRFTDYTETVPGDGVINDKIELDIVAGANINVFGSNALDLEVGAAQTRYDEDILVEFLNFETLSLDTAEVSYGRRLRTLYFSPTFSRPLGTKSGLNVTAAFRKFASGGNVIVAGAASGVLDPLSPLYEGIGVFMKIKTFLVPKLITTFGVGYWDKTHLATLVLDSIPHPQIEDAWIPAYLPHDREDDQSRAFVSAQMPIPDGISGFYVEPSLLISYRDNSSTIKEYNYYGWMVTVGVSLKR
ncbi:MAG: hypothetical protein OEV49_14365 [candidate division Zixibacteria bacterium]|nr:hypothetical protein [candidate division Zixibacteria bacterium]MDH3939028.1 hypothetical protein [candidate division Zixibacteria bacterium]